MIQKLLIVAAGSGAGGALRFYISQMIYKYLPAVFPFGTLAVNILGSIFLGVLIFGFDSKNLVSPEMKLLLGVGFCGGFTTFSTFSFETFSLIKDSEFLLAGANVAANLIFTIAGVFLGYLLTKQV